MRLLRGEHDGNVQNSRRLWHHITTAVSHHNRTTQLSTQIYGRSATQEIARCNQRCIRRSPEQQVCADTTASYSGQQPAFQLQTVGNSKMLDTLPHRLRLSLRHIHSSDGACSIR